MSIFCKFGFHHWRRDGRFANGKRKYKCRCGAVGHY